MSSRIGFVKFTAFDLPTVLDLEGIKSPNHPMRFANKVLSLAESHPFQPPLHPHAPQLDRTADGRLYKFTSELSPLMAAFWEHIEDVSVRREVVRRWYERHRHWEIETDLHWRHIDLLHDWMTELLFQRVYERVGRATSINRKIAAKKAQTLEEFQEMHREQRLLEADKFPKLLKRALENPFIHEVKEPNQLKAFDKARAELAAYRLDRHEKANELLSLRRINAGEELSNLREKRAMDARFAALKGRANLRKSRFEVADAHEAAWRHTVADSHTFRDLMREVVVEQAELFPALFKAALVDPWETEIRLPNNDNRFQIVQKLIDRQRLGLKSIKEHERNLDRWEDRAHEGHLQNQQLERDERLLRREGRRSYEQQLAHGQALAGQNGMIYLAGRTVPRAAFKIVTDTKSTVQLSLGIQGSPNAPLLQAAVPPQLDAAFASTAGVKSLTGELFESAAPAKIQENQRTEAQRKLLSLQALNGYGAGKKIVGG